MQWRLVDRRVGDESSDARDRSPCRFGDMSTIAELPGERPSIQAARVRDRSESPEEFQFAPSTISHLGLVRFCRVESKSNLRLFESGRRSLGGVMEFGIRPRRSSFDFVGRNEGDRVIRENMLICQ